MGGYPSGKTLIDRIYQSISKKDKQDIGEHTQLTEVTEQLVRLHSGDRKPLIRILDPIFKAPPKSLKYHLMLSNIPHFKTNVTTNYDKMLESAYGPNARRIVKEVDIGSLHQRPAIFKIHGDIEDWDAAVVTKSDYTTLYASINKRVIRYPKEHLSFSANK